jgi:hypothetical protein
VHETATRAAGQSLDRFADSTWPDHRSLHFVDLAKELPNLPPAKSPLESARNGYKYYKHLQAHDGHWPGEYGGPMFLVLGLVIGSYITGTPFTDEERREPHEPCDEDGGRGMYVRCPLSTRLSPQNRNPVTSKALPPRLEPH